jgi:hypothetical protein
MMATLSLDALPASCLSVVSLALPRLDWHALRLTSRRCRDACDAAAPRVRASTHEYHPSFCVSTFHRRFGNASQVVLTRDCPHRRGGGGFWDRDDPLYRTLVPLEPSIVADIAGTIASRPARSWESVAEVALATAPDNTRPLPAPVVRQLPRVCPRLARVDMGGGGGHADALLGALDDALLGALDALAGAQHLTALRLNLRLADIAAPGALGAAALGRLRGLRLLALTVTQSVAPGGGGGGQPVGPAQPLHLPLAQLPELTELCISVAHCLRRQLRPSLAGLATSLCSLELWLNTYWPNDATLGDTVEALRSAGAAQVTTLSVGV